ncbi:MAG: hypothetical protein L6R36_005738 [Xanthoria steineri]|nr:MAG: hypothetical protein L6R36_005738 [Xanthoria steineri]
MPQATFGSSPGRSHTQEPKDHEFDTFVNLMYRKLPQELIDNIEYWLYETAFCPGYLYPHRQQKKHSKCCPWPKDVDVVARPALLGLSKAIKAKYETRMWSENVWVINTGEVEDSLAFIHQLPREAREKYIQKVHLSLTICDLDRFSSETQQHQPPGEGAWCVKKPHARSPDFDRSWRGHMSEMYVQKLQGGSQLPLRSLVLDLSADGYVAECPWVRAWIKSLPGKMPSAAGQIEGPEIRVLTGPQ